MQSAHSSSRLPLGVPHQVLQVPVHVELVDEAQGAGPQQARQQLELTALQIQHRRHVVVRPHVPRQPLAEIQALRAGAAHLSKDTLGHAATLHSDVCSGHGILQKLRQGSLVQAHWHRLGHTFFRRNTPCKVVGATGAHGRVQRPCCENARVHYGLHIYTFIDQVPVFHSTTHQLPALCIGEGGTL